jgi:hypothetical protein
VSLDFLTAAFRLNRKPGENIGAEFSRGDSPNQARDERNTAYQKNDDEGPAGRAFRGVHKTPAVANAAIQVS